jgi:hypothetical protein
MLATALQKNKQAAYELPVCKLSAARPIVYFPAWNLRPAMDMQVENGLQG